MKGFRVFRIRPSPHGRSVESPAKSSVAPAVMLLAALLLMILSACNDAEPEKIDIDIASDKESTIEEAVGVTMEGQRFVLRYEDPVSQIAPEGVTEYYVSYEFQEGIMDADTAMIWYGFGDEVAYRQALKEYVDSNTDYFLRRYNDEAMYYAYYVLPAVQDSDGDGKLSWDEVIKNFEDYEKENAKLVR